MRYIGVRYARYGEPVVMFRDGIAEQSERRLRRVIIGERELLQYFNALDAKNECVSLPFNSSLPEGYRVEGIHYAHEYAGFSILVSHPSFSDVPLGGCVPLHSAPWGTEYLSVRVEWPTHVAKTGVEK